MHLLPVPPLPLLASYTTAVETALPVGWVTGTLVRVRTNMEVICIFSFFISGGKPQVLVSISTGTVHVSSQFYPLIGLMRCLPCLNVSVCHTGGGVMNSLCAFQAVPPLKWRVPSSSLTSSFHRLSYSSISNRMGVCVAAEN